MKAIKKNKNQSHSHKHLFPKLHNISSILVLCLVCLLNPLGSQPANTESKEEKKSDGNTYDIKNYRPFIKNSNDISVSNLNFERRFSVNGLGEVLTIVFSLNNLSNESMDLYAYVIAWYETDGWNKDTSQTSRWVPHTNWRKRNFQKEHTLVHKLASMPKDIPVSLIWNENDSDYHFYEYLADIRSDFISKQGPRDVFYPPVWKYLEYIKQNPREALRFTLPGVISPDSKDSIQSNKDGNKEQAKDSDKQSEIQLRYLLHHEAHKTIFRTYHFSPFTPNRKLFNRAAIQIFNAKKVEEGKNKEAIVFRKLYRVYTPYKGG